jgi:peptide deformylase
MSVLSVLEYPDPRLRRAAAPVTVFDAALARLVDDLFETMYSLRAIGLAAPQVGAGVQVIVIDVSEDRSAPELFINPRVVVGTPLALVEESCLSLPGLVGNVRRALRVDVQARDRQGGTVDLTLEDMRAVALQHELDHLHGVLFLDRLSSWRRLHYRWRRPSGGGREAPRLDAPRRSPGASK